MKAGRREGFLGWALLDSTTTVESTLESSMLEAEPQKTSRLPAFM
jgi:hypothetical protein